MFTNAARSIIKTVEIFFQGVVQSMVAGQNANQEMAKLFTALPETGLFERNPALVNTVCQLQDKVNEAFDDLKKQPLGTKGYEFAHLRLVGATMRLDSFVREVIAADLLSSPLSKLEN